MFMVPSQTSWLTMYRTDKVQTAEDKVKSVERRLAEEEQ
jgi:hypothetical protein